MDFSIVIPIYNETDNIPKLHQRIRQSLDSRQYNYEIIYVNDGSTDGSSDILTGLANSESQVRCLHFRRNTGQTAALSAGIQHAVGDIIIPMDGDNQNDPADIPKLLEKLDEGYDVVSGWRKDRKDTFINRTLPSRIANWLISRIGGVHLHDYGCTLKAYRRDVIQDVKLYGEMHRFIPIYAHDQGARITEIPVTHHPRKYGKTKYGISRTYKVILDLLLIKFMDRYLHNPIHLFGGFGLISVLLSLLCFFLMIYYKFWGGKTFIETPLPQLAILFFLMGFMALLIGFIAELLMRTYYESQNKWAYSIKKKENFPN